MLRRLRGTIWPLALAGVALAFGVRSLDAQATAENTVITNTATVSFTDANDNSYANVQASVSVTVGFVAGVDVTGPASAAPSPGSNGNTLAFSVQNLGNGTDAVVIDSATSVDGIVTITGWVYDGITHNTLADLNNAIAADSLVQDTTITIDVVYNVAAGTGGQPVNFTFTASSGRDSNKSDNVVTTITPAETIAVTVSPDSNLAADRLPSNGTNYIQTFVVKNTGNGPETFDLVGSTDPGGAITIVSGPAASAGPIAAGDSVLVSVTYSIGDVAAGTVDTLIVTATSQSDGTTNDRGHLTVRVVRPALSVAKEVFKTDTDTTAFVAGDSVVPTEEILYKVTVTNSGTATADSLHIDDLLPSDLTFLAAVGGQAGWTISNSGNDVDAYFLGLPAGESRHIWIRARVN